MRYSAVSTASILAEHQTIQPVPEHLLAKPYVLVIDDDSAIVTVVMFLLETEGFAGIGISDSQQALSFLRELGPEKYPRVILLDLMMPGLSGYEMARTLMQNEQLSSIPIVIMTADNRVHGAEDVQGAIDWISKPFHLDLLMDKLKRYLASSAG
jgi:two-component system, OmpR family, phosphate regulon response regulator PhoB